MPDIALTEIVPDPENVRVSATDPKKDADLDASIKAQGVLQPILLRPIPPFYDFREGGRPEWNYMVVCGHRRFASAQRVRLETIPAEIREFVSEADVRLAQFAENARRADMSALDVWGAVEAAAAAGMDDESIALAMNRTVKNVRQFRALGSLDQEVQALIRGGAPMPPDHQLRVICQASRPRQAEAVTAALAQTGNTPHYWNFWTLVAQGLSVRRIPLSRARFDRKLYTGPVFGDLFAAEEGEEQAEDVEQFLKLQTEWMQDRCGDMLKKGFAHAEVLQRDDKFGRFGEPEGADRHRWTALPDRLPKKADRAGLVYSVQMDGNGEVEERLWAKKPPKAKGEKREAPALGTPPRRRPDGRDFEARFFTNDGIKEVEKHKRRALGEALEEGQPFARDLDVLVAVLGVLLRDRVRDHHFGHGMAPSLLPLINDEGRLDIDGKLPELVDFARSLAGYVLRAEATLPAAELVGDFLAVPSLYPADHEALSHLKREAVEHALKAMGHSNYPTLKAGKAAIAKQLVQLGPEHVPAIGWRVRPKPRTAEPPRTGLHASDDNPMERISGADCEDYPEPDAMTDEQLTALLAAPESLIDYAHDELRAELESRGEEAPALPAPDAEESPVGDVDELGPEHADLDLREQGGAAAGTPAAAFKAWEL